MTLKDVRELIESLQRSRTDGHDVEAKRAENEAPKTLWQTLSAFSNTPGGGVILLGLDENSGFTTTGVKHPAKIQADLATLCGEMEPQVRAVIQLHHVDGKTIISAAIPEVDRQLKPCYFKSKGMQNGAFIRVGDGNRKLTTYEVHVMVSSRSQPQDEREAVLGAAQEDLDPLLVAALLARLRARQESRFRQQSDEQSLRTLSVLVREGRKWVPSLAGLMALGSYPQQFFPAMDVTFVYYPGLRPGEPGPGGTRFLDNRKFEGPIPRMIGPILDALRHNMKRRAVVQGAFRSDIWEYPEEAVREAVVNALVHRDLGAQARGTPTQIQMYPDRLVVLNPGGLFGPVTVEELGQTGITSARNQVLMKLLEDTPALPDSRVVCENRGSGIGAIQAALQQAGMTPPVFEDRISTFGVTFSNETLLDERTMRWMAGIAGLGLSDSQRMALAVLHRGGSLDNESYRQLNGIDSRDAARELKDLRAHGLVQQIGAGRGTQYQLTPEANSNTGNVVSPRRGDRRPQILALLAQHGELSRAALADALGLGHNTTSRWLAVLRSEGAIEYTTPFVRSPYTRYRIATLPVRKAPKAKPRG